MPNSTTKSKLRFNIEKDHRTFNHRKIMSDKRPTLMNLRRKRKSLREYHDPLSPSYQGNITPQCMKILCLQSNLKVNLHMFQSAYLNITPISP